MGNHQQVAVPKIFISYSHDSPLHKKWVLEFASNLMANGVDVILDQWELGFGYDVAKFMQNAITQADRVLMICTELYVAKADEGRGGVGYEAMIVTGELVNDLGSSKFIPIIRQEKQSVLLPKSMSTRLYINLSNEQCFDDQFLLLLMELHKVPLAKKPLIGPNPFAEKHKFYPPPKPTGEKFPTTDVLNGKDDSSPVRGTMLTESELKSKFLESNIIKQLVETFEIPIDKVKQIYAMAESLEGLASLLEGENSDFWSGAALANWRGVPYLVEEINLSRKLLHLGPLGFKN